LNFSKVSCREFDFWKAGAELIIEVVIGEIVNRRVFSILMIASSFRYLRESTLILRRDRKDSESNGRSLRAVLIVDWATG
jgi:hypothetical protein